MPNQLNKLTVTDNWGNLIWMLNGKPYDKKIREVRIRNRKGIRTYKVKPVIVCETINDMGHEYHTRTTDYQIHIHDGILNFTVRLSEVLANRSNKAEVAS